MGEKTNSLDGVLLPTFLHNANALDRFKCDLCGGIFPKALIHEHHIIKRASGGQDTKENILRLDATCHTAVHQVEAALKKGSSASDLASSFFPTNFAAQKKVLELAASAALGRDPNEENAPLDYSAFDNEQFVYLTPAKVSPRVKQLLMRVVREMKNPRTKRTLGVSEYLRLLIEADLKKRGLL